MEKGVHNAPVGIFDSGLGGLTVMKAVMRLLPNEDLLYFGDTARVPYGTKSPASIIKFSRQNADVLTQRGVKAIVVACNSSSSYALETLKAHAGVPVIGVIEPGVRRALETTRNGRIGVIATRATVASCKYQDSLRAADSALSVIQQACPLFVPLVEEGWYRKAVTESIARDYLKSLQRRKVDTLILGCTHYPLLKTVLRRVMGPDVRLVDSAHEVSRDLADELTRQGLAAAPRRRAARYEFLVSDEPEQFQRLARRFLGHEILKVKKIF